jgi:hypothetical protein
MAHLLQSIPGPIGLRFCSALPTSTTFGILKYPSETSCAAAGDLEYIARDQVSYNQPEALSILVHHCGRMQRIGPLVVKYPWNILLVRLGSCSTRRVGRSRRGAGLATLLLDVCLVVAFSRFTFATRVSSAPSFSSTSSTGSPLEKSLASSSEKSSAYVTGTLRRVRVDGRGEGAGCSSLRFVPREGGGGDSGSDSSKLSSSRSSSDSDSRYEMR